MTTSPDDTSGRLGDRVLYALSSGDAELIQGRRAQTQTSGNPVREGQLYPADIAADWGGSVNLRVILDGNDAPYWATSRAEGLGPGRWHVKGKRYAVSSGADTNLTGPVTGPDTQTSEV